MPEETTQTTDPAAQPDGATTQPVNDGPETAPAVDEDTPSAPPEVSPGVWAPTGVSAYDEQPEEERVVTEPVSYDPDDPGHPDNAKKAAPAKKAAAAKK